jgi:exosortase F-associated protein
MSLQHRYRILIGIFSVGGLVFIFLFQRQDIASILGVEQNISKFIVNRSIRFLLNDALAILLIYALFVERKYVLFAIGVQLVGMVFVLIPYFILKVNFQSYNGPLISFLHRLVLNPTLILLLIPAFYYQRNSRFKV